MTRTKTNKHSFHQYSTKQLPKNVLAAEPKRIDDFSKNPQIKYEQTQRVPPDTLRALKTVNLEEIQLGHIAQKQAENEPAAEQKQIINWEPSPATNLSNLPNQYLMLSKFRLTSKFPIQF